MSKILASAMLMIFMLVSLESFAGFIKCNGKTFSSTARAIVTQAAILKACGELTQRTPGTLIYEDKGKVVKFIDGILTDVVSIKS